MKNLVKNFRSFLVESHHEGASTCCNDQIDESGNCMACGQPAEMDTIEDSSLDDADVYGDPSFESKKPSRKAVLKAADEKYPNLTAGKMKGSLKKMKGDDFKQKAEKYFGWADEPEAAAAAFIRKATKKEPRDI